MRTLTVCFERRWIAKTEAQVPERRFRRCWERLYPWKGEGGVGADSNGQGKFLTRALAPSDKGRSGNHAHAKSSVHYPIYYTLVVVLAFAVVRPVLALTPGDLSRVRFEQHPGLQISGDLVFRDESGRSFKLGDHFGHQPTILVLGYYRCPMLCTRINDGLIEGLENLRSSVGSDFQVVDLSIDPGEKSAAAAQKKALYLRRYGRSGAAIGWHCLVGDERQIRQLADEIGYRYAYDPQTQQYAHPSGVVILTPEGRISRYIFGVTFRAIELREALAAAKEERSSSVVSQLFLLCFHYNPIAGKYSALILSIVRIASAATLVALILFVLPIPRWARSVSRMLPPSGRQPPSSRFSNPQVTPSGPN